MDEISIFILGVLITLGVGFFFTKVNKKYTFNSVYQFFFERWTVEIIEQGKETFKRPKTLQESAASLSSYTKWFETPEEADKRNNVSYTKDYVKYKYTNKYDGSVKIKKVYL